MRLWPLSECSVAKRRAEEGEMVEQEMWMYEFLFLPALLPSIRLLEMLSTTCRIQSRNQRLKIHVI
jgi:hypothetical protein